MSISKYLLTAAFVGAAFVNASCTQTAKDEASKNAGTAVDATKVGADRALDATKKAGKEVAEKSKEVASAAGAAMTDGWLTTKVKAKFADETVLKGSDITVETTDHVMTLKGTVPSDTAKARAVTIARGTEGVTAVVNQLVVG